MLVVFLAVLPVIMREVKEVDRSAIPVNWFPLISKLDKLDGKDGKIPGKSFDRNQV